MSTTSARHRVNVTQLVLGVVYLAGAATWAVVHYGAVSSDQLGWLLPAGLVAAGVVGLAAFAAGAGRGRATRLPSDGSEWSADNVDPADADDLQRTTVLTRPSGDQPDRADPVTPTEPDEGEPHD